MFLPHLNVKMRRLRSGAVSLSLCILIILSKVLFTSVQTSAELLREVEFSQTSTAESSSGLPVQPRTPESQSSSSSERAQPSHYLYVPNNAGNCTVMCCNHI